MLNTSTFPIIYKSAVIKAPDLVLENFSLSLPGTGAFSGVNLLYLYALGEDFRHLVMVLVDKPVTLDNLLPNTLPIKHPSLSSDEIFFTLCHAFPPLLTQLIC